MNRGYKVATFILAILLILETLLLFMNSYKGQVSNTGESQIAVVTDEKNELQKDFDATLQRLDSVNNTNNILMHKLSIKKPTDSLVAGLTDDQKRVIRLADSVDALKQQINGVAAFMNRNIDYSSLTADQQQAFDDTGIILGNMLFRLDIAVDQNNLQQLKKGNVALAANIGKYNKKLAKLDKLSNVLEKFTKYLTISIDVFAAAVSKGIIVTKSAAAAASAGLAK